MFCEHEKQRRYCRECKGSAFCEHNKMKIYCKTCDGSRLCKTPLCETISSSEKYQGYCLFCYINTPGLPKIEIPYNYKTKERDVSDRIDEYLPDYDWKTDKKIEDGCSLRRPDKLLDMGSHVLIIEIDEHKHSTYDCSCENKRIMQLSMDVNHRPIVIIRFNPDSYTDENGRLITSCWKVNGKGFFQIHKELEWEQRINCLMNQIQYWIINTPSKTVEIIELFY